MYARRVYVVLNFFWICRSSSSSYVEILTKSSFENINNCSHISYTFLRNIRLCGLGQPIFSKTWARFIRVSHTFYSKSHSTTVVVKSFTADETFSNNLEKKKSNKNWSIVRAKRVFESRKFLMRFPWKVLNDVVRVQMSIYMLLRHERGLRKRNI